MENTLYEDNNVCFSRHGRKYIIWSKHAERDYKGLAIYELEALTNYYSLKLT